MRGKRVLFICAKRAAIDVVFARLRQKGLDRLCCLIHDSQTDKKDFILDLKATYEGFLNQGEAKTNLWHRRRLNLIKALRQEIEPLERFHRAMVAEPALAGTSVRRLLERAIELEEARPELTSAQEESLPDYSLWMANGEALERLALAIARAQPDGILARHPMRLLAAGLAGQDRPAQSIDEHLPAARRHVETLAAALMAVGYPAGRGSTVRQALELLEHAAVLEPLARRGLLSTIDDRSERGAALSRILERQDAAGASPTYCVGTGTRRGRRSSSASS